MKNHLDFFISRAVAIMNIDKMSPEIPKEIREFILENGVMALASANPDPWVCTLYYGTDDQLNLYVITDPNSTHGRMISKNNNVAFNIFDSHTKITDPKKGIQGKGVCTIVTDLKEIAKGLMIWHKANPGREASITLDAIKKWKDTKIYKIKPTYLKFFNKALYGKQEYGIWEV